MSLFIAGCASYPHSDEEVVSRIEQSPQYRDGKFRNDKEIQVMSVSGLWNSMKEVLFNKHPLAVPQQTIPLSPQTAQYLAAREHSAADHTETTDNTLRFARLGHSTMLIELAGKTIITDPVFSQRASPLQWLGPKRFHPLPIDVNQLPHIDAVVISHNHYDHLDQASIVQLKDKVTQFVVPLGIGDTLRSWGVDAHRITELDWWESTQLDNVELVATPAQHFSGRGLGDSAQTLWSSWVIRDPQHALFFSGDTGYFDGFETIGERYGPFDYAFMECGAYNENWADVHMLPQQTLQAFMDIRGKALIPVHNGTFDLAAHAWYDPMRQISELAQHHQVTLLTPQIGQLVEHDSHQNIAISDQELSQDWWQSMVDIAWQDARIRARDTQSTAVDNRTTTPAADKSHVAMTPSADHSH
jgi:L-ascorbate metabolism protein UlaG (beta-lactamase superfamily)